MDKRIISFTSKTAAKKFADELHAAYVTERIAQGYTVISNEIVGKVNGVDNPSAQRTTAWTEVDNELDGTFSIIDESVNDLFDTRLSKQLGYTRKTITIIEEVV